MGAQHGKLWRWLRLGEVLLLPLQKTKLFFGQDLRVFGADPGGDNWRVQVVLPGSGGASSEPLPPAVKADYSPTFPFRAMSLQPGPAPALRSQRRRDKKSNKFICCVSGHPLPPSLPRRPFWQSVIPNSGAGPGAERKLLGQLERDTMGFKWGLNWLVRVCKQRHQAELMRICEITMNYPAPGCSAGK